MRGLLGILLVSMAGVCGAQDAAIRPPVQGTLVDGPGSKSAPYRMPATSAEGVLEDMSARAGVIFTGTVTAVRMPADEFAGVVVVDFAVAQGVRGVSAGATYTVREWAGLWRDAPRFRVGQQRLMLLYAPGPAGLSSPVDGMDGAIPVVAPDATGAVEANVAGGEASVDLRWLDARTLRTVSYDLVAPVQKPVVTVPRPTVGHVLGLLTAWEARRNAR